MAETDIAQRLPGESALSREYILKNMRGAWATQPIPLTESPKLPKPPTELQINLPPSPTEVASIWAPEGENWQPYNIAVTNIKLKPETLSVLDSVKALFFMHVSEQGAI
jgi:hypothetical protein